MTDMQLTVLQEALAEFEICHASKPETPADAHKETLRHIEDKLSTTMSIREFDVVILMACLGDQRISSEAKDKIAANLGRIAPYAASRCNRLTSFIRARETGVRQFSSFQAEASNSLTRAIGMISVAQAALAKLDASNVRDGLDQVLGSALNDLIAASTVFDMARAEIEGPSALAQQTVDQNKIEEDLLAEAYASTWQ